MKAKIILSSCAALALTLTSGAVSYANTFSSQPDMQQVQSVNLTQADAASAYLDISKNLWETRVDAFRADTYVREAKASYARASQDAYMAQVAYEAQQKITDDSFLTMAEMARQEYASPDTFEIFDAISQGDEMADYLHQDLVKDNVQKIAQNIYISNKADLDEAETKRDEAVENKNDAYAHISEAEAQVVEKSSGIKDLQVDEFNAYLQVVDTFETATEQNELMRDTSQLPYFVEETMNYISSNSSTDVEHVDMLGTEYTDGICLKFDQRYSSSSETTGEISIRDSILDAQPGDTVYILNDEGAVTSIGEYALDGWVLVAPPSAGVVSYMRLQPERMAVEDSSGKSDKHSYKMAVDCTISPDLMQYSLYEEAETENLELISGNKYEYTGDSNYAVLTGIISSSTRDSFTVTSFFAPYDVTYKNVDTGYLVGDIINQGDILTGTPVKSAEPVSSVQGLSNTPTVIYDEEKIQAVSIKSVDTSLEGERSYWPLPNYTLYSNGNVPSSALCAFQDVYLLDCNAEYQLELLNKAYLEEFGVELPIGNTYRTYDQQVICKAEKGRMCATPGESNHGLGKAIDFGPPLNDYGPTEYNWMLANAYKFGWDSPDWARPDGSKPEPWHWEYMW